MNYIKKIFILSAFISGFLFINYSNAVEPTIEVGGASTLRPYCATPWQEAGYYFETRYLGGVTWTSDKTDQIKSRCQEFLDIYNSRFTKRLTTNDGVFSLEYMQPDSNLPCRWIRHTRETVMCPSLDSIVKLNTTKLGENGFTITWSADIGYDTVENFARIKCTLSGKNPETGGALSEVVTGDENSEYIPGGTKKYEYAQRGIYTYKLSCFGLLDNKFSTAKGTVEKVSTVYVGNIPESPKATLSVEPASIKKGESAMLNWETQNAVSVSLNQGIGIVKTSGSRQVSPSATTRYSITAAGEFAELGLARHSVTLQVEVPEVQITTERPSTEVPADETPITEDVVKLATDLKINNSDGPLTMKAPASFNLSWNLDKYCLAYGSWLGIKTKAGQEYRTEQKAGTYTYKLNCPGYGTDEVEIKVVGGTGTQEFLPVAEASASIDGKNFTRSIRVTKGKPTPIWLSAGYDTNGDKKSSVDESGKWTSLMSENGRCEWNSDLNQGIPSFESVTIDPLSAKDCTISLGNLTFFDSPGVYKYGVLNLFQNNGKVSNTGYINIAIEAPPPPKGPPVISLKINNIEKDTVLLGAPAEYTISWNAGEADSCIASGSWTGNKFPIGSEFFVSSQKKDFTYNLSCSNKLGTSEKSTTLKVTELPVCDFGALPLVIDKKSVLNRQSALTWKCQFANSCAISPKIEINNATFGSVRVSPLITTKYTLTCKNLEGASSFEQLVEVR